MPHFIYCGKHYIPTQEEKLKGIFLKKNKKIWNSIINTDNVEDGENEASDKRKS